MSHGKIIINTEKEMKLKEGMMVVVEDNASLKKFLKKKFPSMSEEHMNIGMTLLPNNLVSKVILDLEFVWEEDGLKPHLTIADINNSTVPAETTNALKLRKATEREEFLYHIAGGNPTVVEECTIE